MRVPTRHKELIDAAGVDALDKSIAVTRQLDAEAGHILKGDENVIAMNAAAILIQSIGAEVINRTDYVAGIKAIGASLGFLLTLVPPEHRSAAVVLIGRSMAESGNLKEREDAALKAAN